MSQVISMRLQDPQMERLRRLARRLGRTPSETSALLVEEALRRGEFGHIDFRDSVVGRQAYVLGSSLAVWEVVLVARRYGMDAQQTAEHLRWPIFRVQAALNYAQAFSEEVDTAIADNTAYNAQTLSHLLPQATVFTAGPDTAASAENNASSHPAAYADLQSSK